MTITAAALRPRENPFRSEAVDELIYRSAGVDTAEQVALRLIELKFRGAIIGPHGHGKSTLMRYLASLPRPTYLSGSVRVQIFRDGSHHAALREALEQPQTVAMWIDGYDLLAARWRWALRRRRHVVVTSHRKISLPTLMRCETSPELLGELIQNLAPQVGGEIGEQIFQKLYDKHRGNLRDAFRELYDCAADGQWRA